MSYTIRKATTRDKAAVLALGRKIVDVYERIHLGDEMADQYIGSGTCDSDLSKIYDNATIILDNDTLIGFSFLKMNGLPIE